MELGGRIRQLRTEKGMTQTKLAGEHITRNMLSQIENGSAVPSMKTLQYLAERLNVSVGDLLGEQRADSLSHARQYLRAGAYAEAAEAALAAQDGGEERQILLTIALARVAHGHLMCGNFPAAAEAAKQAMEYNDTCLYGSQDIRAEMLSILVHCEMDSGDAETAMQEYRKAYQNGGWEARYHLLSARHYLHSGQIQAAEREIWSVTALSDEERPLYLLMRGWLAVLQEKYSGAISYLKQVENGNVQSPSMRKDVFRLLETAYKEMGDYKSAYEYAAKQREI